MFLTKKVPEYEQYLKKEYSDVYDSSKLKLEKLMLERKSKFELKEHEKQRQEEEKKAKGIIKSKRKLDEPDEDE